MSSDVQLDESNQNQKDKSESPQKRKTNDADTDEPEIKKTIKNKDVFIDLKKSLIINEYKNLTSINTQIEYSLLEKYFLENKLVFWDFPKWFDLHSKTPRNKILKDYLLSQFNPLELNSLPDTCLKKLGLKLPVNNPTSSSTEQFKSIAERAKHEAQILQRISQLRKEGLWSIKRLPKLVEPQRAKTHWDYLLDEMVWMSTDFVQERKWKINTCKKLSAAVQKYFKEKEIRQELIEKEEQKRVKKQASLIAKEIQLFWKQVEKIIEYKHKSINEEKRKIEMDKHLNFIVDQTEKYSSWLVEGLNQSKEKSDDEDEEEAEEDEDDDAREGDEEVGSESEDDNESTIESDEDKPVDNELEKLKMESELDLNDLLKDYNLDENYFVKESNQLKKDQEDDNKENVKGDKESDDDEDIISDDMSEEEDDEETIERDEKLMEQEFDADKELADLKADFELPIEELLEKLKQPATKKREDGKESSEQNSEDRLDTIAAQAESFQPTGYTLETTNVKTRIPTELLKHSLREYQHVGLDWLVTMYENKLNGILADEMGLGKTIQTISLLAHLAVDKGIWGPHLIVVPTSVMLNWELEFKKWCPGFKILTYYGSQKERRQKRIGWTKQNAFHVCITSYKLVIQDHAIFRRKKWKYFILDEAQNIKNFKSQRWQSLLNFQSQRRLLLTGTPLQNNLMELWSLMHFLMPHVFSSHREFQHWFNNPLKSMIEKCQEVNEQLIKRLHKVLRPFILRRLKIDVEKQMPKKYEHVVKCPLSKRQRLLYDEFMSLSSTKQKLAEGRYMCVINILMQLRKVCNHPDLFEPRPINSPFVTESIQYQIPSLVFNLSEELSIHNLYHYHPSFSSMEFEYSAFDCHRARRLQITKKQVEEILIAEKMNVENFAENTSFFREHKLLGISSAEPINHTKYSDDLTDNKIKINYLLKLNKLRCIFHKPIYGKDLISFILSNFFNLKQSPSFICTSFMNCFSNQNKDYNTKNNDDTHNISDALKACLNLMTQTYFKYKMIDLCEKFVIYVPNVRYQSSEYINLRVPQPNVSLYEKYSTYNKPLIEEIKQNETISHLSQVVNSQMSTQFPEKRLIQYDCGKLQCLDKLLRDLYSGEHRVLIFTQMTRMLDVLENFLNYHGYKYLRLDGATSIEQRQVLMERFNTDKRIFCFILSTRSGGVGVNLTGADTVVFYDSDWNPTMDAQAQDRCHRIGQTRDVHIYRLISEKTVEENILKKADQKRLLSQMAIEGGCFTTAVLRKSNITELFEDQDQEPQTAKEVEMQPSETASSEAEAKFEEALGMVEDESDVQAAKVLREEVRADIAEFDENEQQTNNKEQAFELNKLETEFKIIETELKPIERYALKFLESTGEVNIQFNVETENEIEQSKKNWELKRLKQLKEEEERKAEEEEDYMMFTYTKSEVRKSTRPIKAKKIENKTHENASSETKANYSATRRATKEIQREIPRETPKRKPKESIKEPVKQLSKQTPPTRSSRPTSPLPTAPTLPNQSILIKSENTLTASREKKISAKEKLPKVKKELKKDKKDTKPLNPVVNNQDSSLISLNSAPVSTELTIDKKFDETKISKRGRKPKPKPKPETIEVPIQEPVLKPIPTEKPKILTLSTPNPITIQPINTNIQTPKPIVKAIITRPNLPIKSVFTIPSTLNRPTINNSIIITKVNTNNVINVPVTSPSKLVFRTVPNIVIQKPASVLSSISLSPSSSSNSSSSQSK